METRAPQKCKTVNFRWTYKLNAVQSQVGMLPTSPVWWLISLAACSLKEFSDWTLDGMTSLGRHQTVFATYRNPDQVSVLSPVEPTNLFSPDGEQGLWCPTWGAVREEESTPAESTSAVLITRHTSKCNKHQNTGLHLFTSNPSRVFTQETPGGRVSCRGTVSSTTPEYNSQKQ